jgi:hypothetical protein
MARKVQFTRLGGSAFGIHKGGKVNLSGTQNAPHSSHSEEREIACATLGKHRPAASPILIQNVVLLSKNMAIREPPGFRQRHRLDRS